MGVKRAIDLAYRALEKSDGAPISTLGPLIHNRQEIERLQRDGINELADGQAMPTEGIIVIRAHGVRPQAYEMIKARGLRIMDGTCPYVHYSQQKAVELKENGYVVVIIGDRAHPEIQGILGYIDDDAYVINTVDEVQALPLLNRVGTIAQTTVSPEKYQTIIAALREKAREIKVCETICDATEENQSAIRKLAAEVDILYVVGGRHSANSHKLAETARAICPRTMLIETPEEIDPEDLLDVARVGVSAGASTPDWVIQRILTRLSECERTQTLGAEA